MTLKRSKRTWWVLAIGIVASLATWGASAYLFSQGQDATATAVSDVGGILVIGAAGLFVLATAMRWSRGDAVRWQWTLVGLTALIYMVGDIVWAYYEVYKSVDPPYPGLPDVFYILMYVTLGVAVIWAGVAYRFAVSPKRPFVLSLIGSLAVLAAVAVFLAVPLATAPETSLAERALSAFYPVADVALGIGPALFVLLMARGLGRGKLARPWMAVAAGAVLIAVADSGYALLQLKSAYQSGNPIDIGWMLGFTMFAMGASLARDAYEV